MADTDLNRRFNQLVKALDKAKAAARGMGLYHAEMDAADRVRLDHTRNLLEIARDLVLDIGSAGTLEDAE